MRTGSCSSGAHSDCSGHIYSSPTLGDKKPCSCFCHTEGPDWLLKTRADRQAFWDAAAVGALAALAAQADGIDAAMAAASAAEIADLLLVERMQRIDKGEI